MKIQIYVIVILILLLGSVAHLKGQPKLSVDIGIGFYEPTLTGFDENDIIRSLQRVL